MIEGRLMLVFVRLLSSYVVGECLGKLMELLERLGYGWNGLVDD